MRKRWWNRPLILFLFNYVKFPLQIDEDNIMNKSGFLAKDVVELEIKKSILGLHLQLFSPIKKLYEYLKRWNENILLHLVIYLLQFWGNQMGQQKRPAAAMKPV